MHKFAFGDHCDETGKDRQVDVYFFCPTGAADIPKGAYDKGEALGTDAALVQLTELSLCKYRAWVALPSLCGVSGQRPLSPDVCTRRPLRWRMFGQLGVPVGANATYGDFLRFPRCPL